MCALNTGDGTLTTNLAPGRDGEFYVEDLDACTGEATFRIGRVACDFRLNMASQTAITDIGVIQCAP